MRWLVHARPGGSARCCASAAKGSAACRRALCLSAVRHVGRHSRLSTRSGAPSASGSAAPPSRLCSVLAYPDRSFLLGSTEADACRRRHGPKRRWGADGQASVRPRTGSIAQAWKQSQQAAQGVTAASPGSCPAASHTALPLLPTSAMKGDMRCCRRRRCRTRKTAANASSAPPTTPPITPPTIAPVLLLPASELVEGGGFQGGQVGPSRAAV